MENGHKDSNYGYKHGGSSQPRDPAQTWQAGSSHAQGSYVWDGNQWLLVNAQTQPPTWNNDPYASSSTEWHNPSTSVADGLDQADFDILSALESQLSHSTVPTVHASSVPGSASHTPQQEAVGTAAADDEPETDAQRHWSIRRKLGWPAPDSLTQFRQVGPLGSQNFIYKVKFNQDEQVKARLSSVLFASKLDWVDINHIHIVTDSNWVTRSPIVRTSRELPFSYLSDRGKTKMRVYMTEHLPSLKQSTAPQQLHAIKRSPHFMLWGVKENYSGKNNAMEYLGTAIIDHRDNEQVNAAIDKAVEAARIASHAHA